MIPIYSVLTDHSAVVPIRFGITHMVSLMTLL